MLSKWTIYGLKCPKITPVNGQVIGTFDGNHEILDSTPHADIVRKGLPMLAHGE